MFFLTYLVCAVTVDAASCSVEHMIWEWTGCDEPPVYLEACPALMGLLESIPESMTVFQDHPQLSSHVSSEIRWMMHNDGTLNVWIVPTSGDKPSHKRSLAQDQVRLLP